MWFSVALAIVLIGLASSVLPPQSPRCPTQCKCGMSVVQCDNLEMKKFGTKVFALKVVNPKVPLKLQKQLFLNVGLEDVNTIYIENARIGEIHPEAFGGLDKLRSLSLVNCEIIQFNLAAVQFPANVEKLSFSGTPLTNFDNTKLTSLAELDISNCNLSSISGTAFARVPKLTYVNIASNRINQVDEYAFATLGNLQEVNLSYNKIKKVPKRLFQNNSELMAIDLSYNPLRDVEFDLPSDLEKLVLKSCKLSEFHGPVLDLLSYLDLSDNLIENIGPNTFSTMSSLEYLDLSTNTFTTLDTKVFMNNTKLSKLVLDNNSLETLPKFVGRERFQTYDFSCNNCELSYLEDDVFENFPAIVELHLASNDLDVINGTFQHLHALTLLDLSDNSISEIYMRAFRNNSALQILNLSGNSLESIDSALFERNRVLKELDLGCCGLTSIWKKPVTHVISSLLILNVASNSIKNVSVADLNVTPNIQVFNISHNNLICNSDFNETSNWLSRNRVSQSKEPTNMEMITKDAFKSITAYKPWVCFNSDFDLPENYDYDTSPFEDADYYIDSTTEKTVHIEEVFEIEDDSELENMLSTSKYFTRVEKYGFFWPAIVFILTSLLVLVVAANVMLLILKKRGNVRNNRIIKMPHVKILPWFSGSKIKKHSGSVYRPLSEENIEPRLLTTTSTRFEVSKTVPVHNS